VDRSLSILIVDDDNDNASSLGDLFELDGHRVHIAHSGEEAITAYKTMTFDIAFMDVMMPGKNGVESFIEIKAMCPAARVYMMTGYSVEQLLQQAIDNGALGVFAKPVDMGRILCAVEDIIPEGLVLVAEDDPSFGPELAQLITAAGHPCEIARDRETALARIKSDDISVVILDLGVPLIDGIEVYQCIRKVGRKIPAVMITSNPQTDAEEVQALGDVEVTGILCKPFDPDVLLKKLDRLVA
jgi:CheY-like chemotaxis protein